MVKNKTFDVTKFSQLIEDWRRKNMVEDNLPDYLSNLMYFKDNSFLEELDELNIKTIYKKV